MHFYDYELPTDYERKEMNADADNDEQWLKDRARLEVWERMRQALVDVALAKPNSTLFDQAVVRAFRVLRETESL